MQLAHAARFGPLLRRFRAARSLSQEKLADHAEISARHLSFLETGRASPSREMVLVLASALDLPLRDRNGLLVAAGFAPVYASSPLDGPGLDPVRRALDHLLRAHEPFGAIVLDRDWDVLRMNDGARRLLGWALEGLCPPPDALGNLIRAVLDPGALRSRIANWDEVAPAMVDRALRELDLELDEARRARMTSLLEATGAATRAAGGGAIEHAEPAPVIPVRLRRGDREISLFTTITTLGTPIDVTAQELRIESYFPADRDTEAFLRALADHAT